MYEEVFWGIFIAVTILAVVGLVLVVLRKKGKAKPFLNLDSSGLELVSGDKSLFIAVIVGAVMLNQYSLLLAIAYAAVFLALYLLILIKFK